MYPLRCWVPVWEGPGAAGVPVSRSLPKMWQDSCKTELQVQEQNHRGRKVHEAQVSCLGPCLKNPNFQENLDWENLSRSGARAGGINSSSRSLCSSMFQKQMGTPDRVAPLQEHHGIWKQFEEGRWQFGKWSTEYVSHEDKEKKQSKKRQSCCLIPSLLWFLSCFGRGKSLKKTEHCSEISRSLLSFCCFFLPCTLKRTWGKNYLLNEWCRIPTYLFNIFYLSFLS